MLIGRTDPDRQVADKETPPHEPTTVQDLYATILKAMGVDYREEIMTPIGRPLVLAQGEPIDRLLG